MKTILALLWTLPLIGFANSPSVEFQEALFMSGILARPAPPTLGELSVDPYLLEDIRKLTAEKKERLAAQLAQIIPQTAQEQAAPPDKPVVGDERPGPRGESPKLAILILQEIGTDEQKVSAFGDLGRYGDSLSDACRALATCEGGRVSAF